MLGAGWDDKEEGKQTCYHLVQANFSNCGKQSTGTQPGIAVVAAAAAKGTEVLPCLLQLLLLLLSLSYSQGWCWQCQLQVTLLACPKFLTPTHILRQQPGRWISLMFHGISLKRERQGQETSKWEIPKPNTDGSSLKYIDTNENFKLMA